MPFYDYKCTKCKKEHELFHSFEVEAPPCPDCKGELKKLFRSSPPDLASSIRVQGSIDRMRSNLRK